MKITKKQLNREKRIIEMYLDGVPVLKIYRRFNLKNHSAIYKILENHGIEYRRNPICENGITLSPRLPNDRVFVTFYPTTFLK